MLHSRRAGAPEAVRPETTLASHLLGLSAWAEAIGGAYELDEAHMEPEVSVDGWLRVPVPPHSEQDGRIRILIGRTVLVTGDIHDHALVATPRHLLLPDELQGQRYGRTLLQALVKLWLELGVEQARYITITERGRATLTASGWSSSLPGPDNRSECRLTLSG